MKTDLVKNSKDVEIDRKFWIKLSSSIIFSIGAFEVFYPVNTWRTQKWAFSVSTLIAGIWIGSI